MKTERLIEVITSALNDCLCEGCEEGYSDGEFYRSCDECRTEASLEITKILRQKDSMTISFVKEIDSEMADKIKRSMASAPVMLLAIEQEE